MQNLDILRQFGPKISMFCMRSGGNNVAGQTQNARGGGTGVLPRSVQACEQEARFDSLDATTVVDAIYTCHCVSEACSNGLESESASGALRGSSIDSPEDIFAVGCVWAELCLGKVRVGGNGKTGGGN